METAKLAEEQQTEKTALHYIKQLAVVSGNLLSIALLLVMLGLTFFLLRSHFTGVPMAAGHHLYIVSSGSMSPTIDTKYEPNHRYRQHRDRAAANSL